MGRHETFETRQLEVLLGEIKEKYGVLSLETLKRANLEDPQRIPSYKTFIRKLGGIRTLVKK
jgi:hypothetical protein